MTETEEKKTEEKTEEKKEDAAPAPAEAKPAVEEKPKRCVRYTPLPWSTTGLSMVCILQSTAALTARAAPRNDLAAFSGPNSSRPDDIRAVGETG